MKKDIQHTIIEFLEGKLNPAATKELAIWRAAHPDHEKQFEEIKFLWEKAHLTKPKDISIDVDTALQKVRQQLPKTNKTIQLRRRILAWSAAAAILLLGGLFWGINADRTVEIIAISTQKKEQKQVTLPDSSIVWLNENTTLSYPKTFETQNRTVSLKGDAVFEVTHDKQHPFIVQSDDLAVQVLGTKFNVNSKANQASFVHVFNGKVQVQKRVNPASPIILTKGMSASLDAQNKTLSITADYASNQLFWLNKTLTFENAALEEVFDDLSNAYKIKFRIENPALLKCLFSGTFKAKSIDEILETLQLIYNFKINKTDLENYQLTAGSCN